MNDKTKNGDRVMAGWSVGKDFPATVIDIDRGIVRDDKGRELHVDHIFAIREKEQSQ